MRATTAKRTDTERVNFLDRVGGAIINDDGGRFAVALSGFGPVAEKHPKSSGWTFWVKASEFRKGVRAAIDVAMLDAERTDIP